MDQERLLAVLRALEGHSVKYVIVGAVAINLHGLARATEDVDLVVAPEAGNIDRLKQALREVFDDPSIDDIRAEDLLGEYPAIQYVPPDGAFHLDLLTRLGEMFAFDTLPSERLPFSGLSVPVVTARGLYQMKKGTLRLKDKADAEMLRRRFGPEVE